MQNIFNFWLWVDWLHRTVYVAGLLSILLFLGMQIFGWDIVIGIPTIEHTFKHK